MRKELLKVSILSLKEKKSAAISVFLNETFLLGAKKKKPSVVFTGSDLIGLGWIHCFFPIHVTSFSLRFISCRATSALSGVCS